LAARARLQEWPEPPFADRDALGAIRCLSRCGADREQCPEHGREGRRSNARHAACVACAVGHRMVTGTVSSTLSTTHSLAVHTEKARSPPTFAVPLLTAANFTLNL